MSTNRFDIDTTDLLGNLQSSKKPIKIINDANKQLVLDVYFDEKIVSSDTLDSIKLGIKNSNMSDSIKNKIESLNSGLWKDLNIALERDENSTNDVIITLPNNRYQIIYNITYRPWYISQYKRSAAHSFLKIGFNPPSKEKGQSYKFFADWYEAVVNAETFLLRGKFKDYIQAQDLAYRTLLYIFNLYKEDAKNGDKTIRRDFGGVYNLPNDPDPALPGPPTQTVSGVTNKAPVVDNPNIKLPSQEVKQLDVNVAQQTTTQIQNATSTVTSQTQDAVGGLTTQAQDAASKTQGALDGAVAQTQNSLGNAQQSAEGVLSNLSSGIKGAIGGGVLGAGIGALAGGGKGALIGAGVGVLAGGVAGSVVDKLNPKGIKPDGLDKDWSPDKYSPEAIAGNDKFVDPKTGVIGSTSNIAKNAANGIGGALAGAGVGAGIGASVAGGKGALIGGVSGLAVGGGISVGGIGGGALAGAGLGGGIGAALGGGKGAIIGAASGGAVGAAAAKLSSIKNNMPKPKIPKPANLPRIKTVKIARPNTTKGAEALLNLSKSQSD